MRLDLRFSNRHLEDLWCQAVAVLVFQQPTMDNDILSRLDRKMVGFLNTLLNGDRWKGDLGENLLLATQSTIKADKLLFHGMGQGSQLNTEILKKEMLDLGSILDMIDVREFGFHIPREGGAEHDYGACLEISAISLTEPFLKNHMNDPDFILKIIFSIGKECMETLGLVIKRLREHFDSLMEYSIIVDNKTGLPVGKKIERIE